MDDSFSRTIRAAHIKDVSQEHELVADEAVRQALAERFGLVAIGGLRGQFVLQHERGGIIAAQLHMRAKVTQTCVVTLEPFEARIDEKSLLRFVPAQTLPEAETIELDPETLEGPDEIPYTGDVIDLGATLAEQLALALDPYPRKPGAALPEGLLDEPDNPFAALAARRPKDEA